MALPRSPPAPPTYQLDIDPRLHYFHDLASPENMVGYMESSWDREASWDFVDGDEMSGTDLMNESVIARQVDFLALLCEQVYEQFPSDNQTQTAV